MTRVSLNAQELRLVAEGRIEEVVAARITDSEARVKRLLIERDVRAVVTSARLRPEAIPDVVARAETVFEVDGERLEPAQPGGPASVAAWLEGLRSSAPHLFAAVGAAGGGGTHDGPNPWKKESWNRTKQEEFREANPDKAKQLAAAAGVPLDPPVRAPILGLPGGRHFGG